MKKEEIREGFHQGFALADLLTLSPGQDCMMFKAEKFRTDDEVIYIPDMCLNQITAYTVPPESEWKHIIGHCYTGAEFVELCEGDEALAYRLFNYCDWQHPSSALPECEYDDEEDKKWAEEMYALSGLTKACTTSTTMTSTNTAVTTM